MIFGTNPVTARLRFQQQPYFVFAVLLVTFAVLSFFITEFAPQLGLGFVALLTLEIALIGIACVVYVSLSNSPIWIRCPHCRKPIATNTPWICASCKNSNFNIDEFPFSNRCEKCSDRPKAYRCHHKGCGGNIFLSEDMAETNVAYAINAPADEEESVDQKANSLREKEHKLHEIEMAELELRLSEAKQRKDGPKIKTKAEKLKESLNDFYTGSFGAREEASKLKAKISEEFRNQPAEIEWRHKVIDEWLRDNI